jgi:hypothetical protein
MISLKHILVTLALMMPSASPAHVTSGESRFFAEFKFSIDPSEYKLDLLDQNRAQQKWHGWNCKALRRNEPQSPSSEKKEIFFLRASCSKLNSFLELKAKCGMGFGEIQTATAGTRMDFVKITLHCDGAYKMPKGFLSETPSQPPVTKVKSKNTETGSGN